MTGAIRYIACAALMVLALAAPARAESDEDKKTRAFETFERGERQFKQGAFDAAAQLFESAWSTWRDPAYLFNIGLAFEKAERWRLAVEWYGRFVEVYPSVPNISEVRRRHAAAQQSREATRAEVMVTTEPAGARAEIVNDIDIQPCTTPCALRVDPGPTTVRVGLGARGNEAAKSLGPAERWDLALPLVDLNVGPPGVISPPPAPDRTGSIVSWSFGGAALVTGIVFGVMANDSYDEGRALADDNGGLLERDDFDRLAELRGDVERESLAADLSFGAALVGTAIGVVLWFTSEPDAPAPTTPAGLRSATWHF